MTNVTLDDLSFKVKIGSRTLTYTYAENPDNFEKGKDGYWYFYFDGVYANQMSDEVFTLHTKAMSKSAIHLSTVWNPMPQLLLMQS